MIYLDFILPVKLLQAWQILCGKIFKNLNYSSSYSMYQKKSLFIIWFDYSGHGTYAVDDSLKAAVAGVMQKVNKLICIRPLKNRYVGEIGDVIVGRVVEVQQRRWKVETNSRLDSVLQLSAVNLPGGELVCDCFY